MRRAAWIVLGPLACLVGLLAWGGRHAELPDLDVRTVPRRTLAGEITAVLPLGQGFVCARDGLRRIDLLGARTGPDLRPAELLLRADSPTGEVLRTTRAARFLGSGEVGFELDPPVADSAGRTFFFEVRPAGEGRALQFAPWVFHRGSCERGDEDIRLSDDGRARVLSRIDDLCGFALPVQEVGAEAPLRLEVRRDGELLRSATPQPERLRNGHAFLTFEPIPGSRWVEFEVAVTPPAAGRRILPLHGRHAPAPRLLGATAGGVVLPDRDLGFRVWTAQPGAWEAVRGGLGGRSVWLVALVLAAALCLARALPRA